MINSQVQASSSSNQKRTHIITIKQKKSCYMLLPSDLLIQFQVVRLVKKHCRVLLQSSKKIHKQKPPRSSTCIQSPHNTNQYLVSKFKQQEPNDHGPSLPNTMLDHLLEEDQQDRTVKSLQETIEEKNKLIHKLQSILREHSIQYQ